MMLDLYVYKKKVAGSNDRQGDMYTVGVIRGTQGQVNKRT